MADQRRKFSIAEKQHILTRANELGVSKVLREYRLSYSVYTRWRQQFLNAESENKNGVLQSKVEELRKENIRLKSIIANLVVDLEIKSEELKTVQVQGGIVKR
ncbi:MAG: transposase [Bacteroidota bacterium]